jgi:hypothetical protein
MNNQTTLVGIGILVLAGLGGWFWMSNNQPASTNTQQVADQPLAVAYTLSFAAGKLTPDLVSVTQDDQVTIRVTADEKGEFHVSGYEIENFMATPGEVLEFSFSADKLGRYNFEWHPGDTAEAAAAGEDIVIGALVVNPR